MTTQEFNKAVMAFVFAYRAEDKRADSVHMDNAYDEWLEENLDKFEDDDSERDFAQWKNSEGVKPRDCDDVEKVEAMWAEYSGQRKDGADEEGRWVTTKNNHKVHINEEGVPDKGNSKVIESMVDKTAGSGISGPDKEAKIKQLETELEGTKGLMAKSKIKTQIEMLKADWQGTKEEWLAHKKQKQEEASRKSRERQVRGKAEKEAKAQRERIQLEHELRTQPKEKVAQYKIIQENNPMLDDYHVGIRKPSDIKTWDEVLTEDDGDSFAWGDFSKADAEKAQKTGKITVYSSYPIRQGVFVSTSRIQAQQYAGGEGGKVYSKKIPLSKVAWINGDEGQFADTLRKDGDGRGRRDAGEDRWITTKNGHKVHINEEGEPDKGNPHVVNAMKGGDPDEFDPFAELMKGAEEGEAGNTPKREEPKTRRPVSGNNILDSYDGDGDIKSVMRAQGFDGLPQVVSDEEFDRAVKESGVVAKRAYSASSQEVLDAYQDALYNGDWYVECEGGALFGKGMYTVTDYTGKGTEEVETEVNGYARRHAATDPYYVIEDMTLAPGAKIADFKDIGEKWFGKFNSKSIDFDKGMVADGIREIEEEYGPDAALYARSMCGDPAVSERESRKAESAIGEDMAEMIDDITYDLLDRYEDLLKERSMKLRARFGDINAYAAALGYDAVRVGSDKEHATYTVILNRTKTIIKDSRNHKDEEDRGTITFRSGKNGKIDAIREGRVIGHVYTDDYQSLARTDDDDWVTIKGTHVLLNENGEAMSGGKLKGKSFKEAKSQKRAPKSTASKPGGHKVVNGKDISKNYRGDPDIVTVIHKQGFDGLPKVVSQKEFDEAVKASGMVAQRIYMASDQKTLDAYRDALYGGEFYVECYGGQALGQGMYTASSYTGQMTDGVKKEIQGYHDKYEDSFKQEGTKSPVSYTETMTLDPSAKIVDYKEAESQYWGTMSVEKRRKISQNCIDGELDKVKEQYGLKAYTYTKYHTDPAGSGVSFSEMAEAAESFDDSTLDKLEAIGKGIKEKADGKLAEALDQLDKSSMAIRQKFMNIGVYAAAMGYDAIRYNTEYATNPDEISYTIILNRTKTIILDGRQNKDSAEEGIITFRPAKDGKVEAIQDGKVVGWVLTNDVQETKADSEGEFDLQLESKLSRLEDIRRRNRTDASFEDEPIDELIDDFDIGDYDEDWITVNGTHILLNEEGKAVNGGDLEGEDFSHAKSEPTIEHRPTPEVGKRKLTDFLPVHSYRDTKAFKDVAAAHKESWEKADELWAKREVLEEAIKAESRPKPKDEWDEEDEYQSLIGKKPRIYTKKGERLKEELSKVEEDWHKQRKARDEASEKLDKMKEQEHKRQVAAYKPNKLKDAKQEDYEGFTLDKTSNSFGDEYLENGKGRIVEMSPREYLERCAYEIFHNGTMESTMGAVDEKTTDKYAEQMKKGVKFDLPYLNYKDMGQEGRHRAVAAYKAGIETIPVLIIGRPNRSDGVIGGKAYKAKKHAPMTRNGLMSKLWLCGNKYISEKLLDSVCGNVTIIVARDIVHCDEEPAEWITTEKGAHIPLDENGKALGGAGGWAKGKDFSEAKTEEKKKKPRRRSKIRHVHKKPIYVVQNGKASVITTGGKGTTETKGPAPSGKPEEAKGTEKPTEAKVEPEAKAPETKAEPESKAPKPEEPKKEEPKPEDSTPEKKEETDPYRKGTIDDPSPYGENVPCTGMKNTECEDDHKDHWVEVGVSSQEEYNKKAIDFIKQPVGGDIDGYLRKPAPGTSMKPVVVRFNRKTGEIAFGIPGSFFLSYYKAKYNKETGESNLSKANAYFDRLKQREG